MKLFSDIFQHSAFHGIMKRKWDSESHLRVKVRFWMGIRLCHSKLLSHFRIHWEYSRYSWFTRQTAKKRKGSWSFFCASRSRKSSKTFFVYSGENAKKNRWVGFRDIEWIQYIHGYPMQLTRYHRVLLTTKIIFFWGLVRHFESIFKHYGHVKNDLLELRSWHSILYFYTIFLTVAHWHEWYIENHFPSAYINGLRKPTNHPGFLEEVSSVY